MRCRERSGATSWLHCRIAPATRRVIASRVVPTDPPPYTPVRSAGCRSSPRPGRTGRAASRDPPTASGVTVTSPRGAPVDETGGRPGDHRSEGLRPRECPRVPPVPARTVARPAGHLSGVRRRPRRRHRAGPGPHDAAGQPRTPRRPPRHRRHLSRRHLPAGPGLAARQGSAAAGRRAPRARLPPARARPHRGQPRLPQPQGPRLGPPVRPLRPQGRGPPHRRLAQHGVGAAPGGRPAGRGRRPARRRTAHGAARTGARILALADRGDLLQPAAGGQPGDRLCRRRSAARPSSAAGTGRVDALASARPVPGGQASSRPAATVRRPRGTGPTPGPRPPHRRPHRPTRGGRGSRRAPRAARGPRTPVRRPRIPRPTSAVCGSRWCSGTRTGRTRAPRSTRVPPSAG